MDFLKKNYFCKWKEWICEWILIQVKIFARTQFFFTRKKSSLRLIKQIFYIKRLQWKYFAWRYRPVPLALCFNWIYLQRRMKCVESNQTWNFRFLCTNYLKYFCRKIYFYKKIATRKCYIIIRIYVFSTFEKYSSNIASNIFRRCKF